MLKPGMYIDGEWMGASGGSWSQVFNPATGEVVGEVPCAQVEDLERAIAAADKIQPVWGKTNPFDRSALLRKASEAVQANAYEIAQTLSAEQGKTRSEAMQEVEKGAEILRYYAEEAERVYGRIIANEAEGYESHVIYQPVGVTGAISPWNYPIELLAWKIAGAAAAGCAIVCKLPYETPLSPLLFIKAVVSAGFEPGTMQAVTGRGSVLGPALMSNPLVKKIAFTGSTAVGKTLLSQSGATLKKMSLELGGSLPTIICDDCDMEKAVKGVVRRSFRNMGQICIAINRVYVQRTIYGAFLERLADATSKLTIGDASREDVDLGAMCTREGLEKVKAHVADAREKGATILCGGKAPEGARFEKGNFYEPTVIADVNHDMRIMREETFGPAIGVMPFDTLEEAISLANDSPYGLAGICYTGSLHTARRMAQALQCGNVAINHVDAGVINAPYGGWKESGFGHEHGPEGLYEYLRAKHIRYCFS